MTISVVDARPQIAAVEAAIAGAGVPVGNGEKPDVSAGDAYVVAWFDYGAVGDSSLRSRDGFALTVVLQHYGFDPDSVGWAIIRTRAAVLSLRGTTVDGRVLHAPVHEPGPPMARDDDADPPIWWQSDQWRIESTSA